MPAPSVFISYSHKDEAWKDRLVTHLGVLQNQGLLQTWTDRDIGAGDEWLAEIQAAMNDARVAVLLISASSLTSQFILHTEIPKFLERRVREGMAVFPVLCKDCLWEEIPWLARLQARPRDGKALASFRADKRDSELAKIAKEILDITRNGSPVPGASAPAISSAGTSLPALHQIPTPPADFTGRAEDLAALKSALTGGGAGAIFGLQGMGGVGKTTLALKLAEDLGSLYPDAQLYLDLKGVGPTPFTATQAMAHVVRSFYPETRLPESEAEMAGLYRSILHGKRALLLMDNARDRAQVEPLIPAAGSLLLVTSRFHFTLPGLIVRDLDELPEADARGLLLRIAPRIGSNADEIAHLCGHLPLALRLAGSALAERPNLSPSDYARRLKEGKERLDPVEASLNLSYELLLRENQRLWRLLAVFPGTFDAPAAAAVWDLEIDPASDALAELGRSSLVEFEEKDGRYRLHDLAKSFADQHLQNAEREAAERRHAQHYLKVLKTAANLYQKRGSLLAGLILFDAEWSNIQAGQEWAASLFSQDAEAAEACSGYPKTGRLLFVLRQHPRDQIRWREPALAAARQMKDLQAESVHLGDLGNAYWYLGETRRAIEFYEQRLLISRQTGDRRGEGMTLNNLGLAYTGIGETRRAIELHEQALAIAREIRNRRGEGQALGNLATAYSNLGESRRAIEFYEQHLAIAREIGDRRGEGNALGSLGLAYSALGEPRRAIEFHEQGLAIAREIGDRRGEGNALGSLGLAYAALGESGRAIEFHEQWLTIAREIGDRRGEANASWNIGLAREEEGNLVKAAELMQLLADYRREMGHPDAEKCAARVAALRARIAKENP